MFGATLRNNRAHKTTSNKALCLYCASTQGALIEVAEKVEYDNMRHTSETWDYKFPKFV